MTPGDAYTLGRSGGANLWSYVRPEAAVREAAGSLRAIPGGRAERAYLLGLARFIREARS